MPLALEVLVAFQVSPVHEILVLHSETSKIIEERGGGFAVLFGARGQSVRSDAYGWAEENIYEYMGITLI